jgi:hypothetical protein
MRHALAQHTEYAPHTTYFRVKDINDNTREYNAHVAPQKTVLFVFHDDTQRLDYTDPSKKRGPRKEITFGYPKEYIEQLIGLI